jgi:hypothetical protein
MMLIITSCSWYSVSRPRHYTREQLDKRIEHRIKKGMQYNHRKVNNEKELKLKIKK